MKYDFLICSERSGSNFITRLVDNHSDYCGPSPSHLLRIMLDSKAGYGDLQQTENWDCFLNDVQELFENKIGVWKSRLRSFQFSRLQPGDFAGVFRNIYDCEARSNGKSRLFIKENHLYRYWEFLMAKFPESRFVWLVRDPRDMALSWKKSPNLRGCCIRAAKIWRQDQRGCLDILQNPDFNKRIYKVHYEALVADAASQLEGICRFLKVPYEPQMMDLSGNDLAAQNAQRNPDWQNLNKAILSNNFNKYREELSEDEIRYVETICAEEMRALGYAPDYAIGDDPAVLAGKIAHLELNEKPAYLEQPLCERDARRRWQAVVEKICSRSSQEETMEVTSKVAMTLNAADRVTTL